MRRISRAFVPDPRTGLATLRPAFEWFAEGKGKASRKWDGVPILIAPIDDQDRIWRGVRFSAELPYPAHFLEAGVENAEASGWMPVRQDDVEVDRALRAIHDGGGEIRPGTYELCGPGIKGNPEGFDRPTLLKHGAFNYLHCPRTINALVDFLIMNECEGIVWSYDGQTCQLTRSDVGLDWPEGDL